MASVTIVTVTYRSARLMADCLHSIAEERRRTSVDVRSIIVDNDSGDAEQLAPLVAKDEFRDWVTLLVAERNGGFGYGNNLAFRHAFEGVPPDYFFLLNPDTLLRPGAISEIVQFFDQHPDVGIAGSAIENADGSPWRVAFRFPSVWSELDDGLRFGLASRLLRNHIVALPMGDEPREVDWVSGSAMTIRRQVLERVGGFDERFFLYFEETDLCWRAKAAGFACWYVPTSLVMHIRGQSTGVTAVSDRPRRIPRYWFESRRRYFTLTHSSHYAMMADAFALLAHSLGTVKNLLQNRGKPNRVPRFLPDLLANSALLPWKRPEPPRQCFTLASSVSPSTDAAENASK